MKFLIVFLIGTSLGLLVRTAEQSELEMQRRAFVCHTDIIAKCEKSLEEQEFTSEDPTTLDVIAAYLAIDDPSIISGTVDCLWEKEKDGPEITAGTCSNRKGCHWLYDKGHNKDGECVPDDGGVAGAIRRGRSDRFTLLKVLDKPFSCAKTCNLLVSRETQEMLGVKLHSDGNNVVTANQGCLDSLCTERVDITDDTLAKSAHPVSGEAKAQVLKKPPRKIKTAKVAEKTEKDLTSKQLARNLLNVIYGIVPAAEDDSAPDSIDSRLRIEDESLSKAVKFGEHFKKNKRKKMKEGAAFAVGWVGSALRHLTTDEGRRLRKRFFGDKYRHLKKIRKILTGVLEVIDNVLLRSGSWHHGAADVNDDENACTIEDGSGTMAYVYPGYMEDGRYVMYICDFMMGFEYAEWIGTVIHEASHHYDTNDWMYGEEECMDMAQEVDEEESDWRDELMTEDKEFEGWTGGQMALDNADSYQYFVTALVKAFGDEHRQKK